jgi:hypothetical protein
MGSRIMWGNSPVKSSGKQRVIMTQGRASATIRGLAGLTEEPIMSGMKKAPMPRAIEILVYIRHVEDDETRRRRNSLERV